jgi:tetratricopeptide (TPR) repeat protein
LLLTLGQIDEGKEHLQVALSLARELGDAEAQAHACRWMARAFEVRGEFEPALAWIDKGLAVLGDRLTPSALHLRLISGLIFSRQGNYKRARQQALASLLAAEELDQPSIVARAHNLLGIIDRNRGRYSDAVAHFEESLTLNREIGNLQDQAQVQNSLANAYFDLGQWTDADRFYRQAGQTFSRLGNVYNQVLVDNNLGGIALNQGRLDDALHYYTRALTALEQIGGSLWVMGALHMNLGATHVRRKELTTAFEHLGESRRLFDQAKVRDLLPEMHRRLAEAHLAQSDLGRAGDEASQSLAIAEELDVPGEQGLAWRVMGRIAAAEGRAEEAETYLEKAIALLNGVGDDYGLACTQLSLAQLYDQQSAADGRDVLLQECLPVFERLGASIELEQAQALLSSTPSKV